MGWFSFIARPLSSLLLWFQSFTNNWAISIILLTLLVKLATLYWTTKSMRSMKAMAALAPQMKELQAKYGDDKQKIQQEMMALYKVHGVNPLAGCLPMLLQMPIWLALYRMLSTVGELYLSPAIPGWIDDLTATDPFHILPIALVGLMFLQSKLSPATLDSMQQKILMYGLPLMFGVMSFFFPAGLTIYILTNTILSILHTLYMKKFDRSAKTPLATPKPAAAASSPREQAKKRDEAKAKAPAKPVIDVEADDERVSDEDDDAGDDAGGEDDDEPAAAPAPQATQGHQGQKKRSNAQRRGKRKRGKH
jgi:YidC/Oxa1 family membrane protein insertase